MALDINNDGWIVGIGDNGANYDHGFVLEPIPEPMGFSLLALGGIILRRKRR